jgi:hypothetical protein
MKLKSMAISMAAMAKANGAINRIYSISNGVICVASIMKIMQQWHENVWPAIKYQ